MVRVTPETVDHAAEALEEGFAPSPTETLPPPPRPGGEEPDEDDDNVQQQSRSQEQHCQAPDPRGATIEESSVEDSEECALHLEALEHSEELAKLCAELRLGKLTDDGAPILTGQIIHNSCGAIMFRSGLV